MHKLRISSILILFALFTGTASAQYYADFQSLMYPRSIVSSGLGEQGVALRSPLEAMQYNPANLVFSDGVTFSFFRNPFNMLSSWNGGVPMTFVSLTGKVGDLGSAGIEYTYWDLGEVTYSTTQNPDGGTPFHFFQQSIAGAYAFSLTDRFAIGAQLRYARMPRPQASTIEHVFFSAGLTYRPEIFSDKITAGVSLMNFGTSIDNGSYVDTINGQSVRLSYSSPPPAQLNVGLEALAVNNSFFDVNMTIGASKPFASIGGPPDYAGESSFKSLFTNWKKFPEDVTGQVGIGFLWHPIEIAQGISYLQEMYIGYFSTGPKNLYDSFYTHGFRVGLEAYGIRATAGYAGRWHNNNASSYLPWDFPWETFQFTISADERVLGIRNEGAGSGQPVHGIVLAGGYSYGVEIGRMKETTLMGGVKTSYLMKNIWSVEADFPIGENSAIVSAFSYSRMTDRLEIGSLINPSLSPAVYSFDVEMLSFESGFRYHPLEMFQPFFVQVSLGVSRLKPLGVLTVPRYSYKTFDVLAAGCVVPVMESGIVIVPQVGLRTLFMEESIISNRLLGFNHAEFGLKVGYKL